MAFLNSSYDTKGGRTPCETRPSPKNDHDKSIRTSVRAEAVLETEPSGRELIAASSVISVDETHHLARTVPVIVLTALRWFNDIEQDVKRLTGGLNVPVATSHRPLKMRKSASGAPGVFDLAVRTQKIEGSMWSL